MNPTSRLYALLPALLLASCSTVTTPVLKHQTGEALGEYQIKASGRVETGRIVPVVPTNISVDGVEQFASAFTGLVVGLEGAVGGLIIPGLDTQVGMFLSLTGGGWRFGQKYQILGSSMDGAGAGNMALAVVAGYGRYSAKGDQEFSTAAGETVKVDTVQSTFLIDFGVPFSYRISDQFLAYIGLNLYLLGTTAAADLSAVSTSATDFGGNLGIKVYLDQFELGVELALILATDPFIGGNTMIPYYGISAGYLF